MINYGKRFPNRLRTVRRDPIKIVEYDPTWPESFARQRDRIEPVLAPWLVAPVAHIGSTAVPGLPAKPIIDMLARIDRFEDFGPALEQLRELSWVHAPEPGDDDLRKWSICFPDPSWRTHHLHVVEESWPGWPTLLAFRDHLRRNSVDAAEYARIKTELAARDRHDRTAYRAGKAPFIRGVLDVISSAD
jgi:GrpB-like predicted nucleotidyltransferase (UPF0157 family)